MLLGRFVHERADVAPSPAFARAPPSNRDKADHARDREKRNITGTNLSISQSHSPRNACCARE
jgi:hypothetical protein